MSQHRTTVPTGPRALRPAIPAGLDWLVTDLLAKDPAARPGGAAQVAASLRELQAQPGIAAPQAAGPPGVPAAVGSWQLLATASNDRTARLWDPATGRQVAVLRGHARRINAMCALTAGGRQLLATASNDRTTRLWDLATGQQATVLEGHERKINAICPVTAGGRQLLATAGNDRTARLWDPATGQQATALRGHEGGVRTVCTVTVSGRPMLATSGSDDTVRLWDPATGQQTAIRKVPRIS